MIDGSGREYLWTVCENPDILENPLNFVVGLVHATFQDGVGYVEGLSKDKVDNYINRFMANKPSFHDLKGDKGDEKKERHRLIKLILHAVEELKGEIEDLEHKPSQAGDIDGPLDAMLRDVLELKLKARELLKEGKNNFIFFFPLDDLALFFVFQSRSLLFMLNNLYCMYSFAKFVK